MIVDYIDCVKYYLIEIILSITTYFLNYVD